MPIPTAVQPLVLNALGFSTNNFNPGASHLIGSNMEGVDFSGQLWQSVNGKMAAVKNVIDYDLYDTIRLPVGTYGPGAPYKLFANPSGTPRPSGITTGVSFNGNSYDTNITDTNGLAKNYFMVIHNIQVQVMAPAALDTGPIALASTINPTRSTDASADNQTLAIIQSANLRFQVENRNYEEGIVQNFPCEFGVGGWGTSTGTSAAPVLTGVCQNGFGNYRPMTYWRYLKEQQKFNVYIDTPNTITIVGGTMIRVHLIGWLFVPVG